MEISSHYPYYPGKVIPETEGQESNSSSPKQKTEKVNSLEAPLGEKVDLVRLQNQVSPLPETVDLTQAAELLRQVQTELNGWGKDEAQDLYQYERLRELLYRVSQPLEV